MSVFHHPPTVILRAPAARQALLRGIQQMAALMRPTLGPVARTVAISPIGDNGPPEVLDSAATIAQRTLQLPDPFEDMGAMIIRHVALRVFERVGDGAATAAVLAEALVQAASPCLAAGYSPAALRRGIERGLEIARIELRRQVRSIELPSEIAAVAAAAVRDQGLASMIGEVVDSVGADGAIVFENAVGPVTECEYVDGLQWNEGYLSYFLLKAGESTARLLNPRILATDIPVERADQLVPALEACAAAGDRGLLIIAPEVRDSAISLLVVNRDRGVLDCAMAVKAPSFGAMQSGILGDIAVSTGGRCLHLQTGDSLARIADADLGRARHAWVTRNAFGIVGGHGSKERIRARIAELKAELRTIDNDPHARNKLRERIGKLAGTTAIIRVGAATPGAQAELRPRVEAGVTAARLAADRGVVPGGGAALLACGQRLEDCVCDEGEGMGMRILAQALAEPMRTLARNAGLDPEPLLHEVRRRGAGWSFDVVERQWVDTLTDPVSVTLTALECGVSAAASALSAEVLIARAS
jgi:chaperonin GroEL